MTYSDDEGNVSFTRGGPESNFLGASGLNSSSVQTGAGFGNLVGNSGSYVPGTVDAPTSPSDPRSFVTIATGPESELGQKFSVIANEINDIAGSSIPYE